MDGVRKDEGVGTGAAGVVNDAIGGAGFQGQLRRAADKYRLGEGDGDRDDVTSVIDAVSSGAADCRDGGDCDSADRRIQHRLFLRRWNVSRGRIHVRGCSSQEAWGLGPEECHQLVVLLLAGNVDLHLAKSAKADHRGEAEELRHGEHSTGIELHIQS